MPDISPQAQIDPSAQIAADVSIGPFAFIGPDVKIESGCTIEASATVVGRTVVGARSRIFPMCVIGLDSDGESGVCQIGEANEVREHVTIYGGTADAPTRIGTDNLIMIGSQVGPRAQVGDHGIFANLTQIGEGGQDSRLCPDERLYLR